MDEDDLIIAEQIEDDDVESLVTIYRHPDGGVSFISNCSPLDTARVLSGTAHYILENNLT